MANNKGIHKAILDMLPSDHAFLASFVGGSALEVSLVGRPSRKSKRY